MKSKLKSKILSYNTPELKKALYDYAHKQTDEGLEKGLSVITIKLKDFVMADTQNLKEPNVVFTPNAKVKMDALVKNYDKEVAWHGLVTVKQTDTVTYFFIEDILVYPQIITGATVDADPEYYSAWIQENIPILNSIKMQGHSHVNMGITPSGTDESYYKEMSDQIEDYYLFLIVNKRGEIYSRLYDKTQNIVFEDLSIDVLIEDPEESLNVWLNDHASLITEYRAPKKPIAHYSGYSYKKEVAEDALDPQFCVFDDEREAYYKKLEETFTNGPTINSERIKI